MQFRTDQGPFTSVDQLDEVSGIGPATLEKLRPQVTV
ncbi:MAG TPA: helix-hairpin-helix domain-containing protein [Actinomycetota bacterium]